MFSSEYDSIYIAEGTAMCLETIVLTWYLDEKMEASSPFVVARHIKMGDELSVTRQWILLLFHVIPRRLQTFIIICVLILLLVHPQFLIFLIVQEHNIHYL